MNISLLYAPALVAALVAGAVHAQGPAAPVVTDVGPPPAEERSSTGAIVLENSKVPAQRNQAAADASERQGMTPAGSATATPMTRNQARAERAEKRAAEAADLRRRGARRPADR